MGIGLFYQHVRPVCHLHLVQLQDVTECIATRQFLLQELVHLQLLRNCTHFPKPNFLQAHYTSHMVLDSQFHRIVPMSDSFIFEEGEIVAGVHIAQL